jgi:hypothetical protein
MYEQSLAAFKEAVRAAYARAQRNYVEERTVDFSIDGRKVLAWIPDGLGGRVLMAEDRDPARLGEKVEHYLLNLDANGKPKASEVM